ncbi:MAG: DUF1540 domain-containing protein [Clostridia bacterium]|nr:DUF1540 domain-containing protein [Clostridia bacterium]MBQ1942995.1 DUF1540 domain-containing protein [Clostridia bacterium]
MEHNQAISCTVQGCKHNRAGKACCLKAIRVTCCNGGEACTCCDSYEAK